MNGTLEHVGFEDIRRTGWLSEARRCPVHMVPLELCFDETDRSKWRNEDTWPSPLSFDHDDNRIRWRCDRCVGSWVENYFLEKYSISPPALRLQCPQCSGRRVTHQCAVGCCDEHRCIDCGADFNAQVELVSPGGEPREKRRFPIVGLVMSVPGAPQEPFRSGWTRSFRKCPKHSTPLELVMMACMDDPPSQVGWYCAECCRSFSEPYFRNVRVRFVSDANPGAVCPTCGNLDLASVGRSQENQANCPQCDAVVRIRLVSRKC